MFSSQFLQFYSCIRAQTLLIETKIYLITLKYDFDKLMSHSWIHDSINITPKGTQSLPTLLILMLHLKRLLNIAKWINWVTTLDHLPDLQLSDELISLT